MRVLRPLCLETTRALSLVIWLLASNAVAVPYSALKRNPLGIVSLISVQVGAIFTVVSSREQSPLRSFVPGQL
jgi:hypothetical protein